MELFLHNTEHESNLCKNVVTFLEKGEYSDVTFICKGGKKVKAHKFRLSCDSPFLKRLFAERDGYDEMTVVFLPDIDHTILKLVLDFLYEGTMKLSGTELEEFKAILTLLDIRCPDAIVDERHVQPLPSKPPPPVTKLDRAHKIQFVSQKKSISHNIAAMANKESAQATVVNNVTAQTSNPVEDSLTGDRRARDPDDDPLNVPDLYFVPPTTGSTIHGQPSVSINDRPTAFATGTVTQQNHAHLRMSSGQPGQVAESISHSNSASRVQSGSSSRKRTSIQMASDNEYFVDISSEHGKRMTRKQTTNETNSNSAPGAQDLNAVNSRKSRARRI